MSMKRIIINRKAWIIILILWIISPPVIGGLTAIFTAHNYVKWKSGPKSVRLKTNGHFVPGGQIEFEVIPFSSLEGYCKGEIIIESFLIQGQKTTGIRLGKGIEKIYIGDSWLWSDKITKPGEFKTKDIIFKLKYDIPNKPSLIGKKIFFDIRGVLTIPVQIFSKQFEKIKKGFRETIEVLIVDPKGKIVRRPSDSIIERFSPLFWLIGLVLLIKFRPKH